MRANYLTKSYDRVNIQLRTEQIPEVTYDVFEWRMARAIQYRTAGKRTALDSEALPDVRSQGKTKRWGRTGIGI